VKQKSKQGAFTLIELLVTLAIASILMSIAAPGFFESIKRRGLQADSDDFANLIRFSRIESRQRAENILVGPDDNTNVWDGKRIVAWIDSGAVPNSLDSGDEELVSLSLDNDVELVVAPQIGVSPDKVVFQADGYVDQAYRFTFCDNRTAEEGVSITLFASGILSGGVQLCP